MILTSERKDLISPMLSSRMEMDADLKNILSFFPQLKT